MILRLTPIVILFVICVMIPVLIAQNSHAQLVSPSELASKENAFKGIQLDIEKQTKRLKELDQQKKAEQKKLAGLEKNIVPVAANIQKIEKDLSDIEVSITENLLKQSELKEMLFQNRHVLSNSLMAAIRLKRIPSETLFLQTAAPLKTVQTAMILERTAPQIKKRMTFLSNQYQELANLQQQMDVQKKQRETSLAQLQSQQTEIENMIAARQDAIKLTQSDFKDAKNRADKLSREAKSLKDLIAKIRIEVVQRPPPPENRSTSNHTWPVSGSIHTGYGVDDIYGAKTQGVKIKTRPNALVTAPIEGVIRFAGPFKRHGKIIIIEHQGGWHSLISGMERLDVAVGQSVKSGAPIGKMTMQNNTEGLLLYYELRYKGNPINPSKKIKGLS